MTCAECDCFRCSDMCWKRWTLQVENNELHKIIKDLRRGRRIEYPMKCPICFKDAEELAEEVDIGVGIQKYVIGIDCPAYGSQEKAN